MLIPDRWISAKPLLGAVLESLRFVFASSRVVLNTNAMLESAHRRGDDQTYFFPLLNIPVKMQSERKVQITHSVGSFWLT